MHIVTLSADDGLLKSTLRFVEIYEKYKLSACLNVVATGHHKTFRWPTTGEPGPPLGDFKLWNQLQARGHEIMPHGCRHADKSKLPLAESQQLIRDCLAVFARELDNFNAAQSIFNFPYNRCTPELEAWLPSLVKAYRTLGAGISPLPYRGQVRLTTTGFGPGNCEEHLNNEIEQLLSRPSGWLIYNMHGLDDEGWGPLGADYLDRLLRRLLAIPTVRILPTAKALALAE